MHLKDLHVPLLVLLSDLWPFGLLLPASWVQEEARNLGGALYTPPSKEEIEVLRQDREARARLETVREAVVSRGLRHGRRQRQDGLFNEQCDEGKLLNREIQELDASSLALFKREKAILDKVLSSYRNETSRQLNLIKRRFFVGFLALAILTVGGDSVLEFVAELVGHGGLGGLWRLCLVSVAMSLLAWPSRALAFRIVLPRRIPPTTSKILEAAGVRSPE